MQAAQLSALCARLPVPVIPAPGDPAPSAPSLRVLEDLPRRIRAGDSHQTGFIAAGVLLAVLGSVAVVWPAVSGAGATSPWAWYLVVAAALGTALRARVWDSAPCKAWLLGHSFLITTVLLGLFAATGDYTAAWWALAALGALTAVWVVVALNPRIARPDTYSLPVRRLLGFAAAGLDASLIPVMAYLVGLFAWVLERIVSMASESVIRRVGAVAAVTLTVLAVGGPSAGAITPPQIDPSATPPTGNTGPTQAMAQRGECVTSGLIAGHRPRRR